MFAPMNERSARQRAATAINVDANKLVLMYLTCSVCGSEAQLRIRGVADTFGADVDFLRWQLKHRELRTESQTVLIRHLIILYIAIRKRVALPYNGIHTNEGPRMALSDMSHMQHQAYSAILQAEATTSAPINSPYICLTACTIAGCWVNGLGRYSWVGFGYVHIHTYACSLSRQPRCWGAQLRQQVLVYMNTYFDAKRLCSRCSLKVAAALPESHIWGAHDTSPYLNLQIRKLDSKARCSELQCIVKYLIPKR